MKNIKALLVSFAIPIGVLFFMSLFIQGEPLPLGGKILFSVFMLLSIFVPPFILGRKGEESRKFAFFGIFLLFCFSVSAFLLTLLNR